MKILIALWIVLSFVSVLYNLNKAVLEIREWSFLSDTDKREKIFGDLYNFFIFLTTNTDQKSSILIISEDERTFYLGIYYLYPRKISVARNESILNSQKNLKEFTHIAVYNKNINPQGFGKISTFKSKKTKVSATLYRKP